MELELTTPAAAAPAAQAAVKPPRRRLYTTAEAAHLILGGTDTQRFWGFEFADFLGKFQDRLNDHIGYPMLTPWRHDIDFTAEDYIELARAKDSLDFTRNPAESMDEPQAVGFARRCDLLGMNGAIGSGKDTVGEALEPHGFVRMSFAEPLRIAGAMVYGIPLRYFLDRKLKEFPLPNSRMTPRRVLQLMGTEVCRSICEPLWVKRALLRMASPMDNLAGYAASNSNRLSRDNGIRVAIPDVRFQNEADFVRKLGGRIVMISRPSAEANKAAALHGAGHASESGISGAASDIALVNTGTLESFRAHAAKTLTQSFTQSFDAAATESTVRPVPRRKP